MSELTVSNAVCACTFGMAPSVLEVLPLALTMGQSMPAGNINSATPFAEVMPFGMCMSLANPAVAAATAAALGVLTPMPCTPVTSVWAPGSPTVMIGGMPALNNTSMAVCGFGGVVTISFPGQVQIMIP